MTPMLAARLGALIVGILGAPLPASAQDADALAAGPRHERGWIEHARVMPLGLLIDAKLDSGARTTSIHAEILDDVFFFDDESDAEDERDEMEPEVDETDMLIAAGMPDDPPDGMVIEIDHSEMIDAGRQVVVFRITNASGRSRVLRREVVRWVDIRRRGGGTIRRPVVRMAFCIAGLWAEGEVNLADRTGFNYPLLIGRNMLMEAGILVDARQTYTHRSHCEAPQGEG